jgi:hypothetical protein
MQATYIECELTPSTGDHFDLMTGVAEMCPSPSDDEFNGAIPLIQQ